MIRFIAFLLILLGLAPLAQAKKPSQEDLAQLRERLKQLQQEYRDTRESQADATDALRESEKAISDTRQKIRNLELEQESAQGTLKQTRDQATSLEARIRTQQQKLSSLLINVYKHGQGDSLKLLLNGENPNQTGRNFHYMGQVSRAQMALIGSLRADLGKLHELQETTQAKNQELERIKASQLSEQEKLQKEKQSRQQVLNKISLQLQTQRREIATLKRNELRLTQLFERLTALAVKREAERRAREKAVAAAAASRKHAGIPRAGPTDQAPVGVNTAVPEAGEGFSGAFSGAFSRLKGLLRLPVKGELMNRFGAPREDGGPNWKGVFIRAVAGADVRAVAPGQVVFADWMRGFGNLIILDHGQGYMSLYSNNESLYKQNGDVVKIGDVIATTGNSGGQAESGVYFELRHNSRPINPMEWVK